MLFLQEGTKLLELRRMDDKINNCYFSMADALQLEYYYCLCDVDDLALNTQDNKFTD